MTSGKTTDNRLNQEISLFHNNQKGPIDMNMKEKHLPVFAGNSVNDIGTREKHLPVFVEDGIDGGLHAVERSECSGEFSVGPVSFKGSSRSSDNSSSILGGVLAGGAVAIGAGKNN